MKNMLHNFIYACVFTLTALSCSKADAHNETVSYPLEAFAVQVGDLWYHAGIDQENHKAYIGGIPYLDVITGVSYTLAGDESTIVPDPSLPGWQWSESQSFVITSSGVSTIYDVVFTALERPDKQGLIFIDEFDEDGIPDPDKWVLCPVGTSDWCNQMSESYDQAYVMDGNLVLVGELKDGKYLAGGIKTQGKFSFAFGRVECRAKLSRYPDGAFPAIWMMPQKFLYEGWPYCGEIDIMEHIRQEPHVHQTIHTHYRNNLGNDTGTTAQTKCDYWDYVTYAVEWSPEKLTFFVEGKETFSYANMNLPNESEVMQWPFGYGAEFYLILNMGLGDPGTWAGPVDDASLPAVMEIDWIKVYKMD